MGGWVLGVGVWGLGFGGWCLGCGICGIEALECRYRTGVDRKWFNVKALRVRVSPRR